MKYLTPDQTQTLKKRFKEKPYLDKGEKCQLANLLQTTEKKIAKWFGDRRSQRRQAGLLAKGEEC